HVGRFFAFPGVPGLPVGADRAGEVTAASMPGFLAFHAPRTAAGRGASSASSLVRLFTGE
ncbi:hypothetical protein, partial [Kitasatospora putterlickiae]|uniref:hypothetical protein n=1 Tax=Kitasatospora putterlickiae TaxID=221725 RepID=UPI0031D98318